MDDQAAVFQSHIDGSRLELSPERALLSRKTWAPTSPCAWTSARHTRRPRRSLQTAVRRTIHWAERCRRAHQRQDQALFAIVQGGTDVGLRAQCAAALIELDFPGYALGGFSVGETSDQMLHVARPHGAHCCRQDKPRYLMGVGRPQDILAAVACGIDMFDCVLPTRNGRNAFAFTADGSLRLRNARHKRDSSPIESGCSCYTCRNFSRAYVHHLFLAGEMLGPDAAVVTQRGVLLPANGGNPAGDSGAAVRRVPGSQPCPLGHNALRYTLCLYCRTR